MMSELHNVRTRNADSWPRHKKKAQKRSLERKRVAREAQAERDRRANRRL